MDNAQQPVPAGDIGDHILPKVIVILTGIVALAAVIVRLLARQMIKRVGLADLLLVISMVFYLVHHYNAYQAAIYPGLGVHQWEFNPKLAAASHYNFKVGSVFFGLNIVFLKIAILLDWIFLWVPKGTRNALFWILHSLIWSNAVFYLIGTFIEAFQCPPEEVGTPKCNIDVAKYNLASGVINVISDITVLIAPHWVIWKLNMSRIKKIGVSVLFLIGALATGSAVARVIYVTAAYRTGDILFNVMTINLWAIAEQTFGYLVIGIPAIPKVLSVFRRKPTSTPSGSYRDRVTWPNSTPRDVWGTGDLDTHVLVTVERGEGKEVSLSAPDRLHGRDEGRNSSEDLVGLAITRS
ncbi:hypothetical protein GGS24DRAFT_477462 [Hypoxylon argillaceum]|nr:hypothetical protein GGS24DRAFT_477462 [Hypoxylon argillaceum]